MSRQSAVLVGAAIIGLGLLAFFSYWPAELPQRKPSSATNVRPTLYCEFYNFMHNAVVVGFNFAVEREGDGTPSFAELFVVEHDGTRTGFDESPPRWIYQIEDETPTIRSPDSETRIVLYGLKPKEKGIIWTEAGIRSNTYRNLEGKCRQAHLAMAATGTSEISRHNAQ